MKWNYISLIERFGSWYAQILYSLLAFFLPPTGSKTYHKTRKILPWLQRSVPKFLIWNKPCLRFDKAPETLFFSLGASRPVDAASPRTISNDKNKYPLEPRVVKYLPVHEFIHQKKSNNIRCMYFTYIFQHSKRNFVSPGGHVMFYLLYRQQWNSKSVHLNIYFWLWKARFIM